MQRATALSPSKHFSVKSLGPIHIPASLYIYLDRIPCKMSFPEKKVLFLEVPTLREAPGTDSSGEREKHHASRRVEAAQASPLYLKSRLLFALIALDCLLRYCVASEISSVRSTGTKTATRVETRGNEGHPCGAGQPLCSFVFPTHSQNTAAIQSVSEPACTRVH